MSEIQTNMVEFQSNGHTTPGYLAQPAGRGPYPGLVVIQEWWGLVPHIKELAERFARQGYIALAPDLYHGQSAAEPDEARKLAMELDRDRAVLEICAAAGYLKGMEAVKPKQIGVIGFCMGGGLSVASAAASADIGAAVTFYGLPRDLSLVKKIHAPLLGLFAEHDHSITAEMVKELGETLEGQSVPHVVHTYPGTEHAFFNDSRPHIYHPTAAQDAWKRTLDWFHEYL